MAKSDCGARDRYQARLQCGLQNVDRDFFVDMSACSAQDVAHARILVERSEQERGLRRSGKKGRLRRECPLQPFRQWHAPQSALSAIGPLTPQGPRQLEQRERV